MEFTDQQRVLVEGLEDHAFVSACPGAGKTHAVVARYLRRTQQEPRKGIALVSFTNAAVGEVQRRCAGHEEATRAPHFIGTFDSFIHRFLVTPLYRRIYQVTPRLIQSWRDAGAAEFRLSTRAPVGNVHMDWFDFDASGNATLRPERIPLSAGVTLTQLVTGTARTEAQRRAGTIYTGLLRAGTISCDASRFLATSWLAIASMRDELAPLIGNRFAEVVVDEAQDCGEDELNVLQFLIDSGVRVQMVADLDQSIYEFRRASPEKVHAFAGQLPLQWTLTNNFRSTPAICALTAALRVGGQRDTACGKLAGSTVDIHLAMYKHPRDIAPQVLQITGHHGLAPEQTIILAHGAADATRAAGATTTDTVGRNRVAAIVDAGRKLRHKADGKVRLAALERVERDLAEAACGPLGNLTLDAHCEANRIDQRWLRDSAMRLCQSLEHTDTTATAFSALVRARVAALAWPAHLVVNTSAFRAPPAAAWKKLLKDTASNAIPFSTVHGVKGLEYPAVAMVLPAGPREGLSRTAVDDWEYDAATEARRVLYVGVSRAQHLCILAVPEAAMERVTKLLARDAVPYRLECTCISR